MTSPCLLGLLWLVSQAAATPSPPPSLLLVTLDTFRGDHVGPDTPHLEKLAASGVSFTRARSPVPLTLPSHASLFTGLYPPEHGVRDNGSFVLADASRTLAEVLADEGYDTAAFVGSFVLDRRFGLAQGFDFYDDDVSSDPDSLESPEAERSGNAVVAAFEQWLADRDPSSNEPFFAWVHLYDPHAPYLPQAPYPPTYAGEIAYTDSLVGRLVGLVPASTLIAVVGDHGEGLGEHEEATHALLIYNATLHVPMILAGPSLPSGRRVAALSRTIDLPSTLLDYLGVGETFGRGRSLRPLVEGSRDSRDAYSESLYGLYHFGFSPLYGIETDTHRFIDAPRRELYELSSDPGELRDRLQDDRPRSRALLRRLDELRGELLESDSPPSELDDATRRQLESLGYVASSRPAENLRDPKDEMAVYHRVQRAQLQRARGQCLEAAESLASLVSDLPYPVPVAYETLGACLLQTGEVDAAEAVYRSALDRGIDSARFHIELGVIALRKQSTAEAEKELRIALALERHNVLAHYHLGNVLRDSRRDPEAIASYREAIGLNPSYVFAWNGLGMTLARSGENDDALEAFRRVVSLQPSEPRGHFNLAVQLQRMGRRDEARPIYQHFLTIAPLSEFPRERARAQRALAVP